MEETFAGMRAGFHAARSDRRVRYEKIGGEWRWQCEIERAIETAQRERLYRETAPASDHT